MKKTENINFCEKKKIEWYLWRIGIVRTTNIIEKAFPGLSIRKIRKDAGSKKPSASEAEKKTGGV
jgi:hypothetical protein